jgi:hypothetical protein
MIPDSTQAEVKSVHGNQSTFPGTTTSHGKASEVSCDALCDKEINQPAVVTAATFHSSAPKDRLEIGCRDGQASEGKDEGE